MPEGFMREQLLKALLAHATGEIEKHKANVEVYLTNPVGIGEHSDVVDSIVKELEQVAHFEDMLNALKNHFQ